MNYNFSAATDADDFVIFTQASATSGTPNLVQVWVYGDGSGHLFNLWIEDKNGEVWAVPLGAVAFTGWQQMTGAIDAKAPWPGGRVYGPDNGAIDYPIRFLGLIVDRTDGPKIGMLSFDNITFSTGAPPAAPTSTPAPVVAGPTLNCQVSIANAQVNYYDITGSTESELRNAMDQLSPRANTDKNFKDFFYSWSFEWNWPDRGSDSCNLAAAEVSLEVEITMPCWKVPAGASPELVTKWEKYIQSIVAHYEPKVANKADNLSSVRSAIQGATCSTADGAAGSVLDSLRAFDATYDDQTKRGETQGAKFP